MRALEGIVFDFDGVIADSERLHQRSYQAVFRPLGLDLSWEDYSAEYLGYDDVGLMRRFARQHGLAWSNEKVAELIEEKSRIYSELAARGAMLFPGTAAFIREAAAAVPIAIASGALTYEIEEILERAGLRDLFVAVVGADQTPGSKPGPDPYLEALHQMALAGHRTTPSRTVAIEDSVAGLLSARTAGLRCVAVTNTYDADELAPHAELIVPGLDALTLDALDTLVEGGSARPLPPSSST